MSDFPAAHSMDTEWFAVDACGHVGHFSTSEAGAMPQACGARADAEDLLPQLAQVFPPCEPILDRAQLLEYRVHEAEWRDVTLLVFLDALDVVADALRAGEARAVRAVAGAAVIFRRITRSTWDALHSDGTCRGCRRVLYDDAWGPPEPPGGARPAALGLFDYGHRLHENWACGPYGLGQRPLRPIKSAQLPSPARELAERVRFEFCFADARYLQPADHLPSTIWGGGVYISADGRTVRTQGDPAGVDDFARENDGFTHGLVLDRSEWTPLVLPPRFLGRSDGEAR